MIKRGIMLAVLGLATLGASVQDPSARLAWMGGCWERRSPSRLIEEMWQAPRGGMMLGVSRTTAGDIVLEYEALRIYSRDGGLVFAATPSRQQPTEFTSVQVGDSVVVFENMAHDFPQRVIYRHAPGDSMHARIEGSINGVERGVDFHYGRVPCAG